MICRRPFSRGSRSRLRNPATVTPLFDPSTCYSILVTPPLQILSFFRSDVPLTRLYCDYRKYNEITT